MSRIFTSNVAPHFWQRRDLAELGLFMVVMAGGQGFARAFEGGSIDPLLRADQIDISGFDVRDRTIRPSCRSRHSSG